MLLYTNQVATRIEECAAIDQFSFKITSAEKGTLKIREMQGYMLYEVVGLLLQWLSYYHWKSEVFGMPSKFHFILSKPSAYFPLLTFPVYIVILA